MRPYVPAKNDDIDEAVCNYYSDIYDVEEMKILMLRESPGVYLFGTLRVVVTVGKNGQAVVKVGGGYLNIADFIA